MIIGKTSTSISISELLQKYSEQEILTAVFPEISTLPCRINSPFRTDNNPSFSIYLDENKHIRFKDFGDSDCKGSLLDLLCRKWNCSFHQVFDKILSMMSGNSGHELSVKAKQIKMFTRKEVSESTKIQVATRKWEKYDYKYWASYGVDKKCLHYAEIYPISYKIVTKKNKETNESIKYTFPTEKYSYAFVERKEGVTSLKIYQPFNTKGYKWCSKMDASVISLWTKVPEKGEAIVIASSTKDALCISSNLHLPAIAPQGEGYNLSDTAVKELKRRYKKVYIAFDGDKAGVQDAEKLSKMTGFPIIKCPILNTPKEDNEAVQFLIGEGLQKKDKAKDWSDIYLYLGKERMIEEFNKSLTHTLI